MVKHKRSHKKTVALFQKQYSKWVAQMCAKKRDTFEEIGFETWYRLYRSVKRIKREKV